MEHEFLFRALFLKLGGFIGRFIALTSQQPRLDLLMDEFFLCLADGLHEQGVPRRVAADMFGMTPRAFHKKLHRLRENLSKEPAELGALAQRIHQILRPGVTISRAELLSHFPSNRRESVTSLLHYMQERGVLAEVRTRGVVSYQILLEERQVFDEVLVRHYLEAVSISAHSAITHSELLHVFRDVVPEDVITQSVQALLDEQQLDIVPLESGEPAYKTTFSNHIRFRGAVGRLFHLNAVLECILCSLEWPGRSHPIGPEHGASIYSYELWEGHPQEREVLEVLGSVTQSLVALMEESLTILPEDHPHDPETRYQCTIHIGQHFGEMLEG